MAGTSNPTAGAYSSFTLKLDREDGDQFLGKLNFTMPPGLTADLRGITYCPEASIAAAAETPGRTEQAARAARPRSQIGTSNVAAGPGSHPFHAVGKIYFAGPFQGAPLCLVAITPALAGPYDYGTVVVRVALHVDPLDAHVVADSETVPSDHRRHPDPDALDPGQHRQAELHDQPDQLQSRSRSPRRGSATRARWPTSAPTSTRSTARPSPSSRR